MSRLGKVLAAQYKNMMENPSPHLLVYLDEADIRIWYFLICGLDKPFQLGEYIFKLTAPDDFPQKPPSCEFYTANGVFEPGGPICISIGEFHADDFHATAHGAYGWRASLGMKGFAMQVVNGMICNDSLGSGIRIQKTTVLEKTTLALQSRSKNMRSLSNMYRTFESFITANPENLAVKTILAQRGPPAAPPAAAPPAAAPVTWDDLLSMIE